MQNKKIEVVPYDSNWPKVFEVEAAKIKEALGNNCIDVYHIGSTAVPHLPSKPKIDIIAVVIDPNKSISDLEKVLYTYKGEWNIPFKYGFTKRESVNVNLHVFEQEHPEIELNLTFRDFLREHPIVRDEYASLKNNLLKDSSSFKKKDSMFTGYNLGKDAFIQKILRKTGYNKLRFLKCTHYTEWKTSKALRKNYFFDHLSINDPYTWTFNHDDHKHFVLYQGVDVIGYSHIELLPNKKALLHIITINEENHSQGFGKYFLNLIEKWFKEKSYKSIHVQSSPSVLGFYKKNKYHSMAFNEGGEYHQNSKKTSIGKYLS
jgi:GrpB-like predicted nucleotidyltransferase (UPF0157 family)